MRRLVIISSSTARNIPEGGGTVRAEDAYARYQFERRREYARRFGHGWLIFSAKWGLLAPDAQIDPSYPAPDRIEATSDLLAHQLEENRATDYDVIEVLGGELYVSLLRPGAQSLGVRLVAPLAGTGLGMGRQSNEIHNRLRRGEPFPLDSET